MILLDLDDKTLKRATFRALNEGWPNVETLIRQLVYRYAAGKDPSAGGYKRAAHMTREQRSESARAAARARWAETTPEERKIRSQIANEARWEPQRRILAMARALTAPRTRLRAWPLLDDEGEG